MWRGLRTRSEAGNLENFGKTERSSVPGLTESSGFMKSRYCGRRTRRKKAQNLTAKKKEKYFISLYVKEGAVEEKISYAERRASLKPGAGHRILQRKKVQEEIKARMEPVRLEQMRQQLLGDAAAAAHEALQNDLTKKVAGICQQKIEVKVLDHELMRMVVGLDQDKHPKAKLEATIAAYVVNGTLESGNTRRIVPSENVGKSGPGIYQSLFTRMALAESNETAGIPEAPPAPLFPKREEPTVPADTPLPPPGEAIDEPAPKPDPNSRIMHVDIE